jgi:hypothetical protein
LYGGLDQRRVEKSQGRRHANSTLGFAFTRREGGKVGDDARDQLKQSRPPRGHRKKRQHAFVGAEAMGRAIGLDGQEDFVARRPRWLGPGDCQPLQGIALASLFATENFDAIPMDDHIPEALSIGASRQIDMPGLARVSRVNLLSMRLAAAIAAAGSCNFAGAIAAPSSRVAALDSGFNRLSVSFVNSSSSDCDGLGCRQSEPASPQQPARLEKAGVKSAAAPSAKPCSVRERSPVLRGCVGAVSAPKERASALEAQFRRGL